MLYGVAKIFSLTLYISLCCETKALFGDPKRQSQRSASLAFILGGLSVAIRFTSLAAWIPIGIIISSRSDHPVRTLFQTCALFGIIGLTAAALIDSWFYGFLCLPILGNLHFNVIEGKAKNLSAHRFDQQAGALITVCCVAQGFLLCTDPTHFIGISLLEYQP